MKFLGLFLKVFAALLILIIAALAILFATFDPNSYRDKITQIVKEETGRDLVFENISLSLFPHLGFSLEQASLSNAPGFSEQPFLTLEKAQLGVSLLPLLKQDLDIEALTLYNLNLNLERNAEGAANWDNLVKSATTLSNGNTTAVTDATHPENPLATLGSLQFAGINIQGGQVTFKDAQAQRDMTFKNIDLNTGTVTFGEYFSVAFSAQTQISQPALSADINLTVQAMVNQDGSYAVRNVDLTTNVDTTDTPIKTLNVQLSAPTIELHAAQNSLNIPNVQVNFNAAGAPEASIQNYQGQLNLVDLGGNLAQQNLSAKHLTLSTQLQGASLPEGKANIDFSTVPSLDWGKQTAELANITFKTLNTQVIGQVKASQLNDHPKVNAQLNLAQTNLRTLLTQLNVTLPNMSDMQTLTQFKANINTDFDSQSQTLTFNDLTVQLDDTTLNGKGSVAQFSTPVIQYELALDKIDLNRYLPKPNTSNNTPPAVQAPEFAPQEVEINLPSEFLRTLTINGKLKIDQLQFAQLNPKNIQTTLIGKAGKLALNPITMDIFNTQVNAQISVDATTDTPIYNVKTNTQNIPVGEVLMAFANTDRLSGLGNINANLTTTGLIVSDLKKNVNGEFKTDLNNGAIKGFNLAQSVREAKAKLSGKALEASTEPLQTDFSSLVMHATVKQSVLDTQKLEAMMPFMRVNGLGQVDLVKNTLDYQVKATVVNSDKGQGGQELKELNGVTLPIKLTGALASPNIALDLESLVTEKAKAEVEKQKKKVVKEVKKQAETQLKEALKGIKLP
ncbi:AsmA family protein [Thiomicrorhabdus aquaedulcis]|uniref:AsmA family protein n=1 Tax=Thiomicrorhabdus aquaedulcis TaxID=2211106 RepID=UPI000FD7967B|nr:AsmA family protein [Thiomicrorhabdus aquaedulcis]